LTEKSVNFFVLTKLKFELDVSPFADIMASVVQGSSLGPAT